MSEAGAAGVLRDIGQGELSCSDLWTDSRHSSNDWTPQDVVIDSTLGGVLHHCRWNAAA